MDRVLATRSFGPAPNPQTLLVITYYAEGSLLSVARKSDPGINEVGRISNAFTYGDAGRKITETNPRDRRTR